MKYEITVIPEFVSEESAEHADYDQEYAQNEQTSETVPHLRDVCARLRDYSFENVQSHGPDELWFMTDPQEDYGGEFLSKSYSIFVKRVGKPLDPRESKAIINCARPMYEEGVRRTLDGLKKRSRR